MDSNTLNCIIAIGVVILLVVLARVIMTLRAKREKSDNIKRMEARQAWTDGFQDRQQEQEDKQEQEDEQEQA